MKNNIKQKQGGKKIQRNSIPEQSINMTTIQDGRSRRKVKRKKKIRAEKCLVVGQLECYFFECKSQSNS